MIEVEDGHARALDVSVERRAPRVIVFFPRHTPIEGNKFESFRDQRTTCRGLWPARVGIHRPRRRRAWRRRETTRTSGGVKDPHR